MFSNDLVCGIIEYIDVNITAKISINDLENNFYYNRYYIMKLFKKELGISIIEYINVIRVNNSLSMIKNDDLFIKIALENGFNSLEYFSEIFKKYIGFSPSKYKKIISNNCTISEKEKMINNILYIKEIINKKNSYLNNKKISIKPTKVLSIFDSKIN